MPEQAYLDQMSNVANALPPTARLRMVLDELLTFNDTGVVYFREDRFGANTASVYRGGRLVGARLQFKTGDVPSFVHELTHARCIMVYDAETINYLPGGNNAVQPQFSNGALPGAPADTRFLTNSEAVRRAWERDHCKTFLDTNLQNLQAWANITDYSSPDPFMTAQEKQEFKQTTATMNAGDQTAFVRFNELDAGNKLRGVVQKSRKWWGADRINAQRIQAEKKRKKDWIDERITYGLNGMSGLGNTHNEYDTVVNQMFYQMHMWGFRAYGLVPLTLLQIAAHARAKSLPAGYLYDQIGRLAEEAHLRRVAASAIRRGANPVITTPATIINPPV